MARVKISEFAAKRMLLGPAYQGVQLRAGGVVPEGMWVAKVDQGVKKRFKKGLVVVNQGATAVADAMAGWNVQGYTQFIAEPYFAHEQSEEQYISFERVRDGIRILHARDGGVDIEMHPEAVRVFTTPAVSIAQIASETGVPEAFLSSVITAFHEKHCAFLEINPLVVREGNVFLLDAAALVDSAGEFFVKDGWSHRDVITTVAAHPAEARVETLAATTPASLKLSVVNPDGGLFFLLSGGGGSIVIADEVQLRGAGAELANYGEYSGGPTREETFLYTREIVSLMLQSKAPKKALVIAGGVANFTDVQKTFLGIIDALTEVAPAMRTQDIRVFVRRGGPNEAAGLSLMKRFLEREGLFGAVYGSDTVITQAVRDAIDYIQAV